MHDLQYLARRSRFLTTEMICLRRLAQNGKRGRMQRNKWWHKSDGGKWVIQGEVNSLQIEEIRFWQGQHPDSSGVVPK